FNRTRPLPLRCVSLDKSDLKSNGLPPDCRDRYHYGSSRSMRLRHALQLRGPACRRPPPGRRRTALPKLPERRRPAGQPRNRRNSPQSSRCPGSPRRSRTQKENNFRSLPRKEGKEVDSLITDAAIKDALLTRGSSGLKYAVKAEASNAAVTAFKSKALTELKKRAAGNPTREAYIEQERITYLE